LKETKSSTRYDDLRAETTDIPRILVVLFLPQQTSDWLTHSADQLILKRCAFWASLRGAPSTTNTFGVTVHLPKEQVFSPDGLKDLFGRIARKDVPRYEAS